jgi:hypothetical protein
MIIKHNGSIGHNSTYHTSTKMSLFEALYGYLTPSIKEYVINSKVPFMKEYLAASDEVLRNSKDHLEQARNQMKNKLEPIENLRWAIGCLFNCSFTSRVLLKFTRNTNWILSSMGPIKFKRELDKLFTPSIFQIKENCMMFFMFLA